MGQITRRLRLGSTATLVLLASVLVACAGAELEEPSAAQPTIVEPTPPPAAPTESSDVAAAPVGEYDPTATMFGIYSGPDHVIETTLTALESASEHHDVSQVPVIIEIMRLYRNVFLDGLYLDTLQQLTGVDFSGEPSPWNAAMEWTGRRLDDYQPPSGYREWKVNLLAQIDPRMASFFTADPAHTLIDLREAVWGGVRTDGIPDLLDPPAIEVDKASFMLPDDRVFGVSINGEHRAYPLRILNAHEMANDWLGGEPISLAY